MSDLAIYWRVIGEPHIGYVAAGLLRSMPQYRVVPSTASQEWTLQTRSTDTASWRGCADLGDDESAALLNAERYLRAEAQALVRRLIGSAGNARP